MSDSHLKRIKLILPVALAVVAGSFYLIARSPSFTPVSTESSVGSPATTNSVPAGAASIQPKITWSQTQVEVTLSPAKSTSKILTFTSDVDLPNITIEAVPEIMGFLTVQPNTFASVPAGEPKSVYISFSIPAGTPFGIYEGTIHVQSRSRTLPQTLKVKVNVGQLFRDASTGISFFYPVELTLSDVTVLRSAVLFSKSLDSSDFSESLVVSVFTNAGALSPLSWFNATLRGHEYTGALTSSSDSVSSVEQQVLNGHPALVVIGEIFGYRARRVFVAVDTYIVEFESVEPLETPPSGDLLAIASSVAGP